jgi:hypothetical protein
MNIDELYQKTISALEKGERALNRFSKDELGELVELLNLEINNPDSTRLEKILCLVDHTATDDGRFEPAILATLKKDLPTRILVFALNCARKHIIQAHFKRGHRLQGEFLLILKALLHSKQPEVVEWTLRTIEECGNQGVFFLQDLDKIKPAPWKWFNPHQRAVREIITLLERRWSRFEKQS